MYLKLYMSHDNRANSKFIINPIYKRLVANGYNVLNELSDKNNPARIEAKITTCDIFIWAVCNEYISSAHCLSQLKLAIDLNKIIIALLISENIDLSLLPDELDGVLDKYEFIEYPNNSNCYFELINTIGTLANALKEQHVHEFNFSSIKSINFEKTFDLKSSNKHLDLIFEANESEIIGVASNPFCVHVFSKQTLEYKHTPVTIDENFTVKDVCRLNGLAGSLLIIGSNKDCTNSYIYIVDQHTYKILKSKEFKPIFDAKGISTTKVKKRFFNSCAESARNKLIYILENSVMANIATFNYNLELIDERPALVPQQYSNIFMQKVSIIDSGNKLIITNSLNRCAHIYDLKTLTHINVFAETLDINIRTIHLDKYENILTLSWNNPCNGFNVFNSNGDHVLSFNLPFNNKENRLFNPLNALIINSNQLLVLDGNYTNLLHLYTIEYF